MSRLAEAIRNHVMACPALPVGGGAISLDYLAPEGPSMSIQLNPGRVVKTYLDNTRIMRQPFTILYRSANTENDFDKSLMIGALNGIGEWMARAGPPELPEGFRAIECGQDELANIFTKENQVMGYSATYTLDYETL
jgi:hypothetical protein